MFYNVECMNFKKYNMDKQEIKDYLKEYLKLEIREESFGFNGSHLTVKLILEDETISEEYIDIKNDDG